MLRSTGASFNTTRSTGAPRAASSSTGEGESGAVKGVRRGRREQDGDVDVAVGPRRPGWPPSQTRTPPPRQGGRTAGRRSATGPGSRADYRRHSRPLTIAGTSCIAGTRFLVLQPPDPGRETSGGSAMIDRRIPRTPNAEPRSRTLPSLRHLRHPVARGRGHVSQYARAARVAARPGRRAAGHGRGRRGDGRARLRDGDHPGDDDEDAACRSSASSPTSTRRPR